MALHATPSGPSEAARNRIVQLSGSGQDTHSETDPCLVCGRPATGGLNARTAAIWSAIWCASVIGEYDASIPSAIPAATSGWPGPTPGSQSGEGLPDWRHSASIDLMRAS
jgi:hypothetical protein